MLLEVFDFIKTTLLAFQKSEGSIYLSDVAAYVEITVHDLSQYKVLTRKIGKVTFKTKLGK